MKTNKLLLAGAMTFASLLPTYALERGFAIVIDPQSYSQASKEVEAYAKSIEADGLKPIIIKKDVDTPEKIREQLLKLYKDKKNPIEGAVFIGDIPIPMVRDAQHLTSAFKMNQT